MHILVYMDDIYIYIYIYIHLYTHTYTHTHIIQTFGSARKVACALVRVSKKLKNTYFQK
jgi:hypothetical protein